MFVVSSLLLLLVLFFEFAAISSSLADGDEIKGAGLGICCDTTRSGDCLIDGPRAES